MADRQIVKSIKRTIKNDDRYKKLKRAFIDLPEFNLNTDEIDEEITSLHESRPVRRLRSKLEGAKFVDEIIKSLLKDQEVRSRLTEILVGCMRTEHKLEDALIAFSQYVQVEYADQLNSIRTKGERASLIESCLRPFYKYLGIVSKLQTKARVVIEDIDKSAYALKNTIEAVKLITHKTASV